MNVEMAIKRSVLISVIMAFGVTALCGCIGLGGKRKILQYDVASHIEEGKSTKADVTRLLGKPIDISLVDGDEKWKFTYLQAPEMKYDTAMDLVQEDIPAFAGEMDRSAHEYTKHTLTVYFSEEGVVTKLIDTK